MCNSLILLMPNSGNKSAKLCKNETPKSRLILICVASKGYPQMCAQQLACEKKLEVGEHTKWPPVPSVMKCHGTGKYDDSDVVRLFCP